MKTFEQYLQDIHADQADGVLDDDMPDSFDDFIGNMDVEEVMKYAEMYGATMYILGGKDAVNEVNSIAKDIN